MTNEQLFIFTILLFALLLFVTERWRYDVIALLSLLAVVFAGIVPGSKAFLGFGHPAVITVAAVLVVGRALQNAGLVDWLAHWVLKVGERPTLQVMALSGLVAAVSGFMNNVGALALLLPVAIRMSRKNGRPSVVASYAVGIWIFTWRHDDVDRDSSQHYYCDFSHGICRCSFSHV